MFPAQVYVVRQSIMERCGGFFVYILLQTAQANIINHTAIHVFQSFLLITASISCSVILSVWSLVFTVLWANLKVSPSSANVHRRALFFHHLHATAHAQMISWDWCTCRRAKLVHFRCLHFCGIQSYRNVRCMRTWQDGDRVSSVSNHKGTEGGNSYLFTADVGFAVVYYGNLVVAHKYIDTYVWTTQH